MSTMSLNLAIDPRGVFKVLRRDLDEIHIAIPLTDFCLIKITTIIEYLFAEILELAGNAAHDDHKVRITYIHIGHSIFHDDELCSLVRTPFVHPPNDHDICFKKDFQRLLKHVHPDKQIIECRTLDSILIYLVHLFATHMSQHPPSDSVEYINGMCDALLPGELARHAKSEAAKSYTFHNPGKTKALVTKGKKAANVPERNGASSSNAPAPADSDTESDIGDVDESAPAAE